ncbi:MAG: hypothetical protein WBM14_15735, partial [Terracidiphilus sp.]
MSSQLTRSAILAAESRGDDTPSFTTRSVPFHSILFDGSENASKYADQAAPEYFGDLNLDQVVESITAGRDEYDLKPFFYQPLRAIEAIHDRQAVFRDLEIPALFERVQAFAEEMRKMRTCLAQSAKFYYRFQKNALFLSAVEIYCSAVERLTEGLASANPASRGLQSLRDYLVAYTASDEFRLLAAETRRLREDLDSIRYSIHIAGKRVTVGRAGSESDLSTEVLQTFEKFRQGAPKEYHFRISTWPEMNHVEAAILDRVAQIYPEIFSRLGEFPNRHSGYLNPLIEVFDREVQFYLAYIEFKRRIEMAGLPFCYPAVGTSREIHARD